MKARHSLVAVAALLACTVASAQYATHTEDRGFVTVRGTNGIPLIAYPQPANPIARDATITGLGFSALAIGFFEMPPVAAAFGGLAILSGVVGVATSSAAPVGPQNVTFFNPDGTVRGYGVFVLTVYAEGRASGGPINTVNNYNGPLTYTAVGNGTMIYGNGYGTSMSIPLSLGASLGGQNGQWQTGRRDNY